MKREDTARLIQESFLRADMSSSIAPTVPVFETCGIQIPLNGIELPSCIQINHPVEVSKKLAKQRSDERDCDVVIKAGDKRLYGHKDILSARSPYFNALFNSNMVECVKGMIDLSSIMNEIGWTTLESLLEYAYTGSIKISETNVQDLMMGANFLHIESVMAECGDFMRRRLTIDNVFSLLFFCRSIAYDKINRFIYNFIDKNFVSISLTHGFIDLSIEEFVTLLERDSLYVDTEQQVFDAITRWIGTDIDRKKHTAGLLRYIRCMEKADCIDLVNGSKRCIRSNETLFESHSFKSTKRVCDEAHKLVLSFRTVKNKKKCEKVVLELYDPMNNSWTQCKSWKISLDYEVNVLLDRKMYFFGGVIEHESGTVFDTVANEWDTMPNIPGIRSMAATGVIEGKIYAAGGFDGRTILSSLMSYNRTTREWSSLAAMRKARAGPASCVLDGKLYVIGGFEHAGLPWRDGECYDPKNNRWSTMVPMKYERVGACAAVLNGKIYVVGGLTSSHITNVVERYDPISNTWTTLSRMKNRRMYASLIVSCGRLFVLGGSIKTTGARQKLASVEMYDPDTNTWEEKESMTKYSFKVGALPVPASFSSPVANIENSNVNGYRFYIKHELVGALADINMKRPSIAQKKYIPEVVLGKDVLCLIEQKMDRICTFVLSTLHQLMPIDGELSVLVLCDSSEQANRIGTLYKRFSVYLPTTKIAVVSDEVKIKKNVRLLKISRYQDSPHIVVGTPTRLLALVRAGTLNLNKVKHIVLEESDKLLGNPEKLKLIEEIFKFTTVEKQVIICTATLPDNVRKACKKFMKHEDESSPPTYFSLVQSLINYFFN